VRPLWLFQVLIVKNQLKILNLVFPSLFVFDIYISIIIFKDLYLSQYPVNESLLIESFYSLATVERLGDVKVKKVASDCLSSFAESISLQFILSQSKLLFTFFFISLILLVSFYFQFFEYFLLINFKKEILT